MSVRTQLKNPRNQVHAGMLFLVLASVWRWTVRYTGLSEDVADGISGLLYGLSIGLMLLGGSRGGMRKPTR
jgi:hypothetical protein